MNERQLKKNWIRYCIIQVFSNNDGILSIDTVSSVLEWWNPYFPIFLFKKMKDIYGVDLIPYQIELVRNACTTMNLLNQIYKEKLKGYYKGIDLEHGHYDIFNEFL
jgi:hypothetical protein